MIHDGYLVHSWYHAKVEVCVGARGTHKLFGLSWDFPTHLAYCWRDLETKKHHKLDTGTAGTLSKLVDYAEEGNILQTHNDVPEPIRQQIYIREEERSERKHRKRKRSDSLPPINISVSCPGYHDQVADRRISPHTISGGTAGSSR